jgi:hypothetical protein
LRLLQPQSPSSPSWYCCRSSSSDSVESAVAVRQPPEGSCPSAGPEAWRRVQSLQRNGCGHVPTTANASDLAYKEEVGGSSPSAPTLVCLRLTRVLDTEDRAVLAR